MKNQDTKTVEQIIETRKQAGYDFADEFGAFVEERKIANNQLKNTLKFDPILVIKGVDIAYKYIDKMGKDVFLDMFIQLIATMQLGKFEEEYIIKSFKYIGMCILLYVETGKKNIPSNLFD